KGWPAAQVAGDGSLTLVGARAVLDADWLERERRRGSDWVWLVTPLQIEVGAWRVQAAQTIGSCDALFERLGTAQESALVRLEAHLDHLDRVLALRYAEALGGAEAQTGRLAEPPPQMAPGCAALRDGLAGETASCAAGGDDCMSRPRVLLLDGVEIGVPARLLVARECADADTRALEAELREAQLRAVSQLVGDTRRGVVSGG